VAELYNLGIGLVAVDSASPAIRTVDSSLRTLSKRVSEFDASALTTSFQRARDSGHELHMVLTGSSLDDDLDEVGRGSIETSQSIDRLGARLRDLATGADTARHHLLQGRDAAGRFTTFKFDSRVEAMAGTVGALVDKLRIAGKEAMQSTGGFGLLGAALGRVRDGIKDGVSNFEQLIGAQSSYFGETIELEHATHQMAARLGGAADEADGLRQEILALGASSQFSVGQITALANELSVAGVNLGEFSAEAQNAMIGLQNTFGVSGEEIAKMTRTSETFGKSFISTLDDTTKMAKAWGIDAGGAFRALPGVMDFAAGSMIRFGKATTGEGKTVVKNVMGMAAAYSRAFGKTMAEAVQDAQATFERFARSGQTNRRVFLGLADDFDPLQKAFMQIGVGVFDSSKIIDGAQNDVIGFASTIRSQLGQLDPFRRSRFLEQLRDELPESTMRLIEFDEDYARAVEENALARQRATELEQSGFQSLSDEMLNTTKALQEMWDNTKQLIKVTLGQIFTTLELKEVFKSAKDIFSGFAASLREFVTSDRFRSWLEAVKPVVQTVGKGVLILGTAFGSIVGILGSAAGALGTAKAAFTGISKSLGTLSKLPKIGGLFSGLTKALGSIGAKGAGLLKFVGRAIPGLGQVIAIVSGVMTAFEDMGDVLGDPLATTGEKLQAVLRGVLKGVGSAINSLLLGIPGMVLNAFFPNMERAFDRGFEGIFSGMADMDIGGMLGGWLDKLGGWLHGLAGWMVKSLPDWGKMAADWGKTIGSAMGGLARLAVDSLVFWIKNFNIVSVLGTLWNTIFSDSMSGAAEGVAAGAGGIVTSLGSMLKSVASVAMSALGGIVDGFLQALGTNLDEVQLAWAYTWSELKQTTFNVLFAMGNAVLEHLWDPMKTGGILAFNALHAAFITLKGNLQTGIAVIQDVFAGNFSGIKLMALNTFKSIADGVFTWIQGTMSNLRELAVAIGSLPTMGEISKDLVATLDKAKGSISGAGDAFGKMIDEARAGERERAVESKSRVTEVRAQIAAEQEAREAATNASLAGVEREKAARQHLHAEINKEFEAEQSKLSAQLNAVAEAREADQARQNAGRMFRKEQEQGLDALFSKMREEAGKEEGGGLSGAKLATFDDVLQDHLEKSLKTISASVASGDISLAEAEKAWETAQQEGRAAAMKAAADVVSGAAAAGKAGEARSPAQVQRAAGTGGGISKEQLMKFIAANQAAAAESKTKVEVRLGGSDAVTREMARQSATRFAGNGHN
jgi:hypothetical protein